MFLSVILFVIGAVGVLVRRNAILIFMSVELMLNACNLAFVSFARLNGNLDGQVVAFFVMVVAAAEVVVGLAILMAIYRARRSASVETRACLSTEGIIAMTTLAATGVFRASWLLLAFPVFGAAVLLLGGRLTDKWGHLLGVLMSLASFVYGVIAFFALLARAGRAQPGPAHVLLDSGQPVPGEHRDPDRPAVDQLRAADHRGRVADPHLRGRLHGARPERRRASPT